MKTTLALLLVLALGRFANAEVQSAQGRTIEEIKLIPPNILQRSVSPQFYKTLLVSPIKGYVVVRGNLSGTQLTGLRVVHSEPNALNNHLALQRAGEVTIAGYYAIENPNTKPIVLVHLLLYKTADGMLALSFAHIDSAGGNQMQYYGSARLAVLKNDGRWVDIRGPDTLEGKGMAVRRGLRNDMKSVMLMEQIKHGAEATNMTGH